jgi:hypothetical protein
MALQLDQTILADHPMVREALERHGFQKINASAFSNGRATVRFEGPMMIAVPGDGSRTWQSNVGSAPPEAVVGILDTVLPIPSFLSQAEVDRRVERAHAAKMALDRIVDLIRENPENHGGPELRRFLWSLFNGHHVLNLWRLRHELDSQRGAWVTEIFTAWMQGLVPDDFLRRALRDSGEMERWNAARLSPAEQRRLGNAADAVCEILRTTPPGAAHSALTRAIDLLREAGEATAEVERSDSGSCR